MVWIKGRTQCRRLLALCGVWGRVVFKPHALPTQMCRGWGSNPGPSGYSQSQKNTSTQTLDISGTLQHGNSPHSPKLQSADTAHIEPCL